MKSSPTSKTRKQTSVARLLSDAGRQIDRCALILRSGLVE